MLGFVGKPKFEHDCSHCILIGQDEEHDVYVHIGETGKDGLTSVSFLIRYGNKGSEYYSPPVGKIPEMYYAWIHSLPRWTPGTDSKPGQSFRI